MSPLTYSLRLIPFSKSNNVCKFYFYAYIITYPPNVNPVDSLATAILSIGSPRLDLIRKSKINFLKKAILSSAKERIKKKKESRLLSCTLVMYYLSIEIFVTD